MGDVYHAWISTYIKDKGWVNGIIEFDGNDWKLMDPTFASTSSDPKDFLPRQMNTLQSMSINRRFFSYEEKETADAGQP